MNLMDQQKFINRIVNDLLSLGVRRSGVLLVHSSLKSLGMVPGGAETVIKGLLSCLGENGTLLMPALSYLSVTHKNPVFEAQSTPSCIGAIPEYFRQRSGNTRSIHPTHSVCAIGPLTDELLTPHALDTTPCGPYSPFHNLPDFKGQILMLGCGLRPNTSMHAIEELVEPPYLYGPSITYSLTNNHRETTQKEYVTHDFSGWEQHYDRVADILKSPDLREGKVLEASSHLIETQALKAVVLAKLHENPLFFVDQIHKMEDK